MKIYNYEKLILGKVYKFENVTNNKIDYFIDTYEKRLSSATTINSLENYVVAIFLGTYKNFIKLFHKGKIIYFL